MEEWDQAVKPLHDLLEMIRFAENVAAKIHGILDEAEIYTTVKEEFAESKRFTASIVLLTDDGSQLRFVEGLMPPEKVKAGENAAGLQLGEYKIHLNKSSIYSQVVREGKTVQVNVGDIVRELFPQPVAHLISEIMGYKKKPSILTPLKRHGKIIGALAISSADLAEHFIPSVRNLAQHISTALELADEYAQRKRLEEEKERVQGQLLQAQKMEAIGILASGVAHDFNNLLGAIQGYAELAMMRVDEADPLHTDLKRIVLAAERGASLTRQLIIFSRKQPMEPTLLNINRTVEHLQEMLNRLIGEDIAINIDLDPDLWTARADEASIEQVIMNLAVNAREAMPKGGKLIIKTENVTLDEENCKLIPEARPARYVCLSVTDTGVGMDEQIIQHIFEPFFTTKEVGKGAGLGLSVVHGIVKQHEGWISVYSEPGQGSTFEVYLPALAIKPQDQTEKTISLEELQGSGERILLVEDEEGVREYLTRALDENGYIVFEAANAKEATDIFEREKGEFHLVFTDVVLSDLGGLELVDQLLSRKPQLGVLLSSGYADEKSQRPVIRERGFRFIPKPYALPDVLRAIREAMEPS